MSHQGHTLGVHYFPAPWDQVSKSFQSTCRCLIDFNHAKRSPQSSSSSSYVFIVLLPDDRLFRLELDSLDNIPLDQNSWTKEKCVEELKRVLNQYCDADVNCIDFPFFEKLQHQKLIVKERPAINLYNSQNNSRFFVSFYSGTPKKETLLPSNLWTISLAGADFVPQSAPDAIIDISKVMTIPTRVDKIGAPFRAWYHENHLLQLHDPQKVRALVVERLIQLAQENHIEYYDTSKELDSDQIVKKLVKVEDEICWKFIKCIIPLM